MAGVQVPSGQDRHSACAGSVNLRQSGQRCSWPWRLHRQITDNVWPCRRLPRCLLSTLQLRLITRSVTVGAAKSLVQAFIRPTCRLDYCNSLFSGIMDSLFRRLQSVQNAAARLITGTGRCDHITPVSRARRVQIIRARLKVSTLAHGAISDRTLNYGRRRLRSADVFSYILYRTLDEHPARRQELRCRRSTVNTLPAELRQPDIHWTCYTKCTQHSNLNLTAIAHSTDERLQWETLCGRQWADEYVERPETSTTQNVVVVWLECLLMS